MEVELRAGAKLDLASGAELKEQTAAITDRLDALNAEPIVQWVTAAVATDGAGAIAGQQVFACPVGYRARIHRIVVNAPGYTPAAPYTTGALMWWRNATAPAYLLGFLPTAGNSTFPAWITEGTHDCAELRHNEALIVTGTGLPINLEISMTLKLVLVAE